MAEHNDSSTETPDPHSTSPALRGRAALRAAAAAPARRRQTVRRPRQGHPVRSFVTLAAVAGLVATVAIPAFAAVRGTSAEAVTLQQVAAEDPQSLVIASEASPAEFERGGYSATTPKEIAKKKQAEAAKKALAVRLASGGSPSMMSIPKSIAAAGEVIRPLTSFKGFGTPYAGHKGTDYMADRGTPIYAIADGVVVASSESGPGWGVYVKIAHNIGGQTVTSLYAHMSYGTRRVAVGQTVSAGQLIGQVGDTGRAYGTHLHLEIYVNNVWVNAESWLKANVG